MQKSLKPTLVLVPGLMCDARIFAPQVEAFDGDYNIIIPKLDISNSIYGLACNLLDEIDAETFGLVGFSLGGIVAMEMLRQAPERIERLALLSTDYVADGADRKAKRNDQIKRVKQGHLHEVIVQELMPAHLAKRDGENIELQSMLTDMAIDLGESVFVNQSIALRDRAAQTETLRNSKAPTLILHGDEDKLCPPERHQEMAALVASVERIAIPQTGHVPTLESPDAVNTALARWLRA